MYFFFDDFAKLTPVKTANIYDIYLCEIGYGLGWKLLFTVVAYNEDEALVEALKKRLLKNGEMYKAELH